MIPEGIVEDIGFRSTRIRTFYNSLVTIPNAVMAREKIDNYQARPKRRIRFQLGVEYETPREKITEFCDGIKNLLCQEAMVDKSSVLVYFQTFGDFSLNILVCYHIITMDSLEIELQEKFNLQIMKLAEQTGVGFAYPTHKVIQGSMAARSKLETTARDKTFRCSL